MRRKRPIYEDRDECANHGVSIWKDAVAFHYTHNQVLNALSMMRETRRFRRLPYYAKSYVSGWISSYQRNIVDRMSLESGSWVRMPDGSERWFGVKERVEMQKEGITYQYITENAIPEKSGLYWVTEPGGQFPHFLPAIDFDPYWNAETKTFNKPAEAYGR